MMYFVYAIILFFLVTLFSAFFNRIIGFISGMVIGLLIYYVKADQLLLSEYLPIITGCFFISLLAVMGHKKNENDKKGISNKIIIDKKWYPIFGWIWLVFVGCIFVNSIIGKDEWGPESVLALQISSFPLVSSIFAILFFIIMYFVDDKNHKIECICLFIFSCLYGVGSPIMFITMVDRPLDVGELIDYSKFTYYYQIAIHALVNSRIFFWFWEIVILLFFWAIMILSAMNFIRGKPALEAPFSDYEDN